MTNLELKNVRNANGMMNVLSEIGLKIMNMHFYIKDYDIIEEMDDTTNFIKITEKLTEISKQLDELKNSKDIRLKPQIVAEKLIKSFNTGDIK